MKIGKRSWISKIGPLPHLRDGAWLAALVWAVALATPSKAEQTAALTGHRVRIVLVGDSTVTTKAGWGLGFERFLAEEVECFNTAAGGRSSRSFREEGRWTNSLVLKGDYYLIQFGHNNEPGKPGRSTDMPTFVQDMRHYVDEARAIGATPILVTPLARRQWDKSSKGRITSSLAPYAEEVKRIGADRDVPVLDLHARSIELYEQLGRERCLKFSPLKVVDGTNAVDNTHLNADGSILVACLVVQELRRVVPELSARLREKPVELSGTQSDANSAEAKHPVSHVREKRE